MKATIKSSGFAVVPYQLMDTHPDYKVWGVYACLHRHGWNSLQGCFASVATISRETGICEKVIQRTLSLLVQSGWVQVELRPGRTTVYQIRVDHPGQKEPGSKMTRVKNAPGTPGKNAPPTRSKNAPLTRTHEQEPINNNPLLKLQTEFAAVSEPPKRKPRAKGSEAFERFWKTYLSAPIRATSQSKPKAISQWQKTIRTETEADLQKALEIEIAHQQAAGDAFVSPLPDCFRWLRDERYATVNDKPAGQQPINHATYVF
jgi:hypothetical protein